MSTTYQFDLAFRGERNYLQGADIFDALIGLTGWHGPVSLHFHRLMRSGVDAIEVADGRPAACFDAAFWYGPPEARRCLGLCANPARPILERKPYDEPSVVAGAVVRPPRIESPGPIRASFMDRVLALNKLLLTRQFAPDKGSFRLARLDLEFVPENPTKLVLVHQASMGLRFVRSEILADDCSAGSVFFSLAID